MSLFRRISGFFRRLWVSMALLIVLAGATVVKLYHASTVRRHAAASATTAAPKAGGVAPSANGSRTVTEEFGEKFANFVLPPEAPKKKEAGPPPLPEEIKRRFVNLPTPISLFPPQPALPSPPPLIPPTRYLPSFRVIRCELIGGPATGNIETPLIGIVVENQYAIDPDGLSRLVIPAGVEVHGIGKPAPIRDRIDGSGPWTFVWRTNDEDNAMELTVNALALNRDFDEATRVYGDFEKSPGILGHRFESMGDKVVQEALLSSAAALARNLKSYTSVLNPLTSEVVNQQKPTAGNALMEGTAAGADRIAQILDGLRKELDEKGYYVAVMPGKEFYLYTKEPVDLRKARRPRALALLEKPSSAGAAATPSAPP